MMNRAEIGDLFMDNNHKLVCRVEEIVPEKFHKYKLVSENGKVFYESEQALMSQRYNYVDRDM